MVTKPTDPHHVLGIYLELYRKTTLRYHSTTTDIPILYAIDHVQLNLYEVKGRLSPVVSSVNI